MKGEFLTRCPVTEEVGGWSMPFGLDTYFGSVHVTIFISSLIFLLHFTNIAFWIFSSLIWCLTPAGECDGDYMPTEPSTSFFRFKGRTLLWEMYFGVPVCINKQHLISSSTYIPFHKKIKQILFLITLCANFWNT